MIVTDDDAVAEIEENYRMMHRIKDDRIARLVVYIHMCTYIYYIHMLHMQRQRDAWLVPADLQIDRAFGRLSG